ncbi:hypothetical protein [Thiomicrorhabdus sp.]|uniref:hypothetical protein n=1 Tax=Thiomicrorhabdus sp. TaxID=2039724 RepID=UPI003562A519
MRTFLDTNAHQFTSSDHSEENSLRVDFLKTSIRYADPKTLDQKCENKVHCLSLNAFYPRLKHSFTWLMGSAPFTNRLQWASLSHFLFC